MQIESLKVYCDVVKHRSFSQAADLNHITQSAVSQIVSHIEKRLGVSLIDRSTRPLRPTQSGREYFEGCVGIVDNYFAMEARLRGQSHSGDTHVLLAAIYSIGLSDMHQYVDAFQSKYPNGKLRIEYLHPDKVYENVLNETADLGLISFPRKSRDLVVHPWREETFCVVCHPQHHLADKTRLRLKQIEGERFVAFDRDLVIRRKVDKFLREQGVSVDIAMEFDNVENIKKAVSIGEGLALLPEPTLSHELNAGTLVAIPLSGANFGRPIGLIHHRHRLSTSAQNFADLLLNSHNGKAARTGSGRTEIATSVIEDM